MNFEVQPKENKIVGNFIPQQNPQLKQATA